MARSEKEKAFIFSHGCSVTRHKWLLSLPPGGPSEALLRAPLGKELGSLSLRPEEGSPGEQEAFWKEASRLQRVQRT